MNTSNAGPRIQPSRRQRAGGLVDFTFMYAAHAAFHHAMEAERLHFDPLVSLVGAALADTGKRLLNMLPPPARLLYRAVWRPGYARTPHWVTTAS